MLAAVLGALLFGTGCDARRAGEPVEPPERSRVVLATPTQPISAPIYVAGSRGFFADRGLEVEVVPGLTGEGALEEVIAGRADFAVTAETPVVHAALRGDSVAVLATVATTRDGFRVVGRRDRGISDPTDLRGKRIGVTLDTNVEFFLDLFLTLNHVDRSDVELVHTGGDEIVPALTGGRVDAAVSWEPHTTRLREELGTEGAFLGARHVYTWFWNVVALRRFADDDPRTTEALLESLVAATNFMLSDPDRARELVASRARLPPTAAEASWAQTSFSVSLDQALVLTMEDQARWVLEARDRPTDAIPNVLRFIDSGPLFRVAPESVFLMGRGRSP